MPTAQTLRAMRAAGPARPPCASLPKPFSSAAAPTHPAGTKILMCFARSSATCSGACGLGEGPWTAALTCDEGPGDRQHGCWVQRLPMVGAPDGRKQQQRRKVAPRQQCRPPVHRMHATGAGHLPATKKCNVDMCAWNYGTQKDTCGMPYPAEVSASPLSIPATPAHASSPRRSILASCTLTQTLISK